MVFERLYLAPDELACLTGTTDVTQQKRWLTGRKVRFYRSGGYRCLLVKRRAVEQLSPELPYGTKVVTDLTENIAVLYASKVCGHVYLIDEGTADAPIKIGWSVNSAMRRLAELQVGNPRRLRLLYHEQAPLGTEQLIHEVLGEYRLIGEWFAGEPVRDFALAAKGRGLREAMIESARYRTMTLAAT